MYNIEYNSMELGYDLKMMGITKTDNESGRVDLNQLKLCYE